MSFILKRPIVYPPLTGEEPQWFMNLWENINRGWAQGATSTSTLVYASVADSSAISNTTTETEFNKSYSVPSSSLVVGSVVRVQAFGIWAATLNPQADLYFRLGGTRIAGHAGIAHNAASGQWQILGIATVRAPGSSGTVQRGYGYAVTGTTGLNENVLANDLNGTVTLNTTTSLTAAVSWKWNAAAAGNSATMQAMYVWIDTAGSTS